MERATAAIEASVTLSDGTDPAEYLFVLLAGCRAKLKTAVQLCTGWPNNQDYKTSVQLNTTQLLAILASPGEPGHTEPAPDEAPHDPDMPHTEHHQADVHLDPEYEDPEGVGPTQPVEDPPGPEERDDVIDKPFITSIMSVNENGLPLEASAVTLQMQIEQQKADASRDSRKTPKGKKIHTKMGSHGNRLIWKPSTFDHGDGTDGKTAISAKQHRLASLVTKNCSIIMAQEVHLTQAHAEILLTLYRANYCIDGEYAAGVPGKGTSRPRKETAGVLTLWHKDMWQRASIDGGKPAPPTRWDPQGRGMTVHLESLIDQSELYVTNGYAPQAGREGADADILTFGQQMNAAARLHSEHAPHIMGMDGNGGPPGYEAGTPNDAWIAQLLSPDSGNYSRAGRPRPTHYSVKGGSKGGTVGWRASVYHAVLNFSKRKSATAATITGCWVALPERLWRPGADDPASVTAIAARRLGVAAHRIDELDPSWRDFALYQVDHEEPPADPASSDAATYVLVANEHTVPAGTAYHAEVRLTLAQLFPPVNDWHSDEWKKLNDKLKPNRVPPAQPGVLHKPWAPRTHLQAPQHVSVRTLS